MRIGRGTERFESLSSALCAIVTYAGAAGSVWISFDRKTPPDER